MTVVLMIAYFAMSLVVAGYAWSVRGAGVISALLCGLCWPINLVVVLLMIIIAGLFGKKDAGR